MSSIWKEFAYPEVLPRLLIFVGMVGIQALVAVWAATSGRHWFVRALAVWLAVSLLVPIQAWEPAWVFMVSSPLTVILLHIGRRLFGTAHRVEDSPSTASARWRFSLFDLLLTMAIAALSIHSVQSIVRSYQPANWLGWIASSVSITLLTLVAYACAGPPRHHLFAYSLALAIFEFLVAYWLDLPLIGALAAASAIVAYFGAFGRRHWWALFAALVAVPACAGIVSFAGKWMRSYMEFEFSGSGIGPLIVIGTVLVAWLTAVIALGHAVANRETRLVWRCFAGSAAAILMLFAAMPVGRVYWRMLGDRPKLFTAQFRETPGNHYGRIAELARAIHFADSAAITYRPNPGGQNIEIWRSTPASPELQSRHDELLALLSQPCSVPYDPRSDATPDYEGLNVNLIQSWRMLVRSLEAEARIARANGEPDRVARLALGMIRLGDMHGRGGLDVNVLVGNGFRRVGYVQICSVSDAISADCLREILTALRASVVERDSIEDVIARQAHFEQSVYGWHKHFQHALFKRTNDAPSDILLRSYGDLDLVSNCVLQTDLAIRLFKQEQGRLPSGLHELVQQYLPSLPLDPYSQPLRYQPCDDSFKLYSIGGDGRDDGGRCGTFNEYWGTLPVYSAPAAVFGVKRPTYDFDLETLTRGRE